jgi:hypothetical protein
MKKRVTAMLDVGLVSKARLAVREGSAATLAGLIERGLKVVVGAIERERRQRFRVRPIKLRAGRKQRRSDHGRPR